jgi:hypothetical protein
MEFVNSQYYKITWMFFIADRVAEFTSWTICITLIIGTITVFEDGVTISMLPVMWPNYRGHRLRRPSEADWGRLRWLRTRLRKSGCYFVKGYFRQFWALSYVRVLLRWSSKLVYRPVQRVNENSLASLAPKNDENNHFISSLSFDNSRKPHLRLHMSLFRPETTTLETTSSLVWSN